MTKYVESFLRGEALCENDEDIRSLINELNNIRIAIEYVNDSKALDSNEIDPDYGQEFVYQMGEKLSLCGTESIAKLASLKKFLNSIDIDENIK